MKQLKLQLFILCLLSLLSACQEIGRGGRIAEVEVKKSLDATKDALERVFTYYPEHEEYRPIPYSFCYRVMQDITCYDHPLPEARNRLVGWQGRDGTFVSSTSKLPSPKSSVQQMSKRLDVKAGVATTAAAAKISDDKKKGGKEKEEKAEAKALEPVFVENPPAVKEEKVKIKVTESSSAAMY